MTGPFGVRGRLSPRVDLTVGLGALGVLILVWCLVTYSGWIRPLFLPSPTGIWEGLVALHQKNWLVPALLGSLSRVLKALALVVLIGVPLGVLMGAFAPVDAALRKLVNGAKSIPTTGIVGLIVLWFSIEERAKIVFLFLGAIFYMILLVKSAIQSVDEDYVKVAYDMGATSWQLLMKILLPGALVPIWEAVVVCNGIMWTYIVLAEFINSNEENLGLGYLLNIASRTNQAGQVFGVLIVIAIISSLTDFGMQRLRRRLFKW
jgi:NitT/TauT family transport system permease protein